MKKRVWKLTHFCEPHPPAEAPPILKVLRPPSWTHLTWLPSETTFPHPNIAHTSLFCLLKAKRWEGFCVRFPLNNPPTSSPPIPRKRKSEYICYLSLSLNTFLKEEISTDISLRMLLPCNPATVNGKFHPHKLLSSPEKLKGKTIFPRQPHQSKAWRTATLWNASQLRTKIYWSPLPTVGTENVVLFKNTHTCTGRHIEARADLARRQQCSGMQINLQICAVNR